jgi:hypothetical protein
LAQTLKAIYLKYGIGYRLSRLQTGPKEGDWFVIVTYADATRAPPTCLSSKEFYETDRSRGFVRGYTFQFGRGVGPVAEAVASDAKGLLPWGADHHAAFRRLNGHRLGLSAICEDVPEEHNRVTLDPVLKDSHDIPAPRIDYRIGENTARMMEHGNARAKEILAAAEATDICVNSPILYRRLAPSGHGADGQGSGPLGGERVGAITRCKKPVHRRRQPLCHLGRREPYVHHSSPGALHRRSDEAAPGQSVRLRGIMSADSFLTPTQRTDLRVIAAVVIPASADFDVPGADDPAIQADISISSEVVV